MVTMNSLLILTLLSLGLNTQVVYSKGCGCKRSQKVLITNINGENLRKAARNIMNNIYESTETVLESFNFEVLEVKRDRYYTSEEPCFNANGRRARVVHNGKEYLASLEISGTAFDDRIETLICRCKEFGANPGNFCSAVLPKAIKRRQEEIKCIIEDNCQ